MKTAKIFKNIDGREELVATLKGKTASKLGMEINMFWCKNGVSNPDREGYRVSK